MTGTVLVTGVARDFPARCARTLAAQYDVVGVDLAPPRHDLGRARFHRADLRSPALPNLMHSISPSVVVHLPKVSDGVDSPVLATMQLLAALERTDAIEQLVLVSSSTVYPAVPNSPARWLESDTDRTLAAESELLPAEQYALANRHPVCILRLATMLAADTPMGSRLSSDPVQVSAGFNPRLQFLHPVDATRALAVAIDRRLTGTFNIAPEDVLLLSQVLRILGRIGLPIPQPLVGPLARLTRSTTEMGLAQAELTYGRVVDTKAFAAAVGWVAQSSTRRSVEEFGTHLEQGWTSLDRLERYLQRVARLRAGRR